MRQLSAEGLKVRSVFICIAPAISMVDHIILIFHPISKVCKKRKAEIQFKNYHFSLEHPTGSIKELLERVDPKINIKVSRLQSKLLFLYSNKVRSINAISVKEKVGNYSVESRRWSKKTLFRFLYNLLMEVITNVWVWYMFLETMIWTSICGNWYVGIYDVIESELKDFLPLSGNRWPNVGSLGRWSYSRRPKLYEKWERTDELLTAWCKNRFWWIFPGNVIYHIRST